MHVYASVKCLFVVATALATGSVAQYSSGEGSLPQVDLGYEIYRATLFNSSGGFYNFSNIRYAAPPVGNLRFRAPEAPAQNRSVVQDGSVGRMCPQSSPSWLKIAEPFLTRYFQNEKNNLTLADLNKANSSVTPSMLPPQDPRVTEDCLFMDVLVPESIFKKAGKGGGAAVLVWIYGGGYVDGDKSQENPPGLLMRSQLNNMEGIVFVAFNYRLGAFGWLPGPTLQSDGVANAALLDQKFALEWIQKNIHKFGGDPNRVTVMGESAGGGSIMHQLTAYGGQHGAPFQQAVLQSPGWLPVTSNREQENTFNRFLTQANVTSLSAARALPSDQLIAANSIQVAQSEYGSFTYGPVVDGIFVPAMPGKLMLQGNFVHSVNVMVGHNSQEGVLFTDPFIQSDADFASSLTLVFPSITPDTLAYVTDSLYPPPPYSNASLSYPDQTTRVADAIAEFSFTCNTNYIGRAYGNKTHQYEFSVPPGFHGEDIAYTFYNNGGFNFATLLINVTVAQALQDYIVSFAQKGVPTAMDIKGLPMFNAYGPDAKVTDLQFSQITRITDPAANGRCLWWQKVLYA